jgi:hypothetical protein
MYRIQTLRRIVGQARVVQKKYLSQTLTPKEIETQRKDMLFGAVAFVVVMGGGYGLLEMAFDIPNPELFDYHSTKAPREVFP